MKDLSYKNFFGEKISHEDALLSKISSMLSSIIMEERNISEKSFSKIENIMKEVKELVSKNKDEFLSQGNKYLNSNKRLNLLAEEIYDKFLNINSNESLKNFGEFTDKI